ncbi:serine hydrolase domain-containing protein [Seonamhaeicola sp.]|uniref:serine hydrolase domain-containing protein n=1 Tax=Seonamhaeicola sp. TaxID=1912245 RepID=UPI00261F6376|nr:serine hydrolase domain-containing protein [Seonamhaeicola sp.]
MKNFLYIFFLSLAALGLSAQTKSNKHSLPLVYASAENAGMSRERLERLDILQEAIDKNQTPGIVVLIARKGQIVYHKAFGLADSEAGIKLKKDDIFRIASQTKAITSTAVMMLWEQGLFGLDDSISKYIPEFKNPVVLDTLYEDGTYKTKPTTTPITIRHLLTHTSGLGYGQIGSDSQIERIYKEAGIIDLVTTKDITIAQNVKKLAKLPLIHNPGEAFTYGEGIDVLGYLVEIISGMSLDKFFRERIFDPLRMEDTWFYLPKNKESRLTPLQKKIDNKWVKHPITFYDPDFPIKGARTYFNGGAGLVSTAKDYANFLQMYLNGGELNGIRLLSRSTIQYITANQVGDLRAKHGEQYGPHGLAFALVNQKAQDLGGNGSEGTYEWGGYFDTGYFADPKEELIGIILKQGKVDVYKPDITARFRQLVYQAIDD